MDQAPAPMKPREWLLAFVGMWLVLVLVHGSLAWGGAAAAGGDLVNQLLPMTVAWLKHGPGWAPGTFAGRPLFADPQTGVLYPPNWLHWVFGEEQVPRTTTLILVAHLVWAGVGMHAFARRFLAPAPAAFAGAMWMIGGVYGGRLASGISVFVTAAAWLPWVMWAIEARVADRRQRIGQVGILGIIAGMQILAGAPQIVYITWAGAFLWSALRVVAGGERTSARAWLRAIGSPACGFALGVLMALPQLAATSELASLSAPRDGGDRWAFVTSDSLQLRQMMHWLFPDFFGAGNSAFYWGSASGFHDSTCWIGMPALVLAVFGATSIRRRGDVPRVACAIVAVLSLALAFGRSSPVFKLAFEVFPTFDSFRVPARWLFWLGFVGTFLAGVGLEELIRAEGERARGRGWIASSLVVALPCAAILAALGPILWRVFNLSKGIQDLGAIAPPDAAEMMSTEARQAVVWGLTMAGTTCIAGLALIAGRAPARFILAAIAILAYVDAQRFWSPFRSTYPTALAPELVESIERHPRVADPAKFNDAFYRRTPLVEELARRGGRYLYTDDVQGWFFDQNQREIQMESAHVTGLQNARGYQQLIPRTYLEEMQRASAPLRPGLRPVPFLSFERLAARQPLDAYNVRSVLTYAALQEPQEFTALGLTEPRLMHPAGLILMRNPHARGWAWLSLSQEWLSGEPDASAGEVTTRRRQGSHEEYDVIVAEAGGACLHVSSSDYPGWEWLDLPEDARIISTRSVFLPAGEHVVRREFRERHLSPGWLAGSILALLAALVCAIWGAFGRKTA